MKLEYLKKGRIHRLRLEAILTFSLKAIRERVWL